MPYLKGLTHHRSASGPPTNLDLFKKTLGPVGKVLEDADLKKTEVDELVLVGGSTRIPKVQGLLKDRCGARVGLLSGKTRAAAQVLPHSHPTPTISPSSTLEGRNPLAASTPTRRLRMGRRCKAGFWAAKLPRRLRTSSCWTLPLFRKASRQSVA